MSQLASTAVSPNTMVNEPQQAKEEGQVYRPKSPYYSLEHPLDFYGNE